MQLNVSLDWIAKEMPIKQDTEREHYLIKKASAMPAWLIQTNISNLPAGVVE